MESGILGLEIKDSALGIRNSSSTNKESKIQKLTAAIRRSFFPFRFSPFPVRRHYPRKKEYLIAHLKTIASNPESKTVKDNIARGRHFIENNYFLKITYFLFSLPWVPKVFFPVLWGRLRGGGRHFRNFWVGMCCWDPGTLNLYKSHNGSWPIPELVQLNFATLC